MNDLIKRLREHYAVYTTVEATLLLLGVSEENLSEESRLIRYSGNGEPSSHPKHKGFKLCYDIIDQALRTGQLPYVIGEKRHYVPYDNRIIARDHLKKWIVESGASELPESLFTESERKVGMNRSPQAFENLVNQLEKAKKDYEELASTVDPADIKIIGAFMEITIGKGKRFETQADASQHISEKFDDVHGIRKRKVDERFAFANKMIDS